jgi:ribosome biogenesis protein NSA1
VSPDGTSLAYGGEEVDLSIWDVEKTFSTTVTPIELGTKRKSKTALFPAEQWRAKNVAHDSLNLRAPVHITSLLYRKNGRGRTFAVGTDTGAIKLYDSRVARRPVTCVNGPVEGDQSRVMVISEGAYEQ